MHPKINTIQLAVSRAKREQRTSPSRSLLNCLENELHRFGLNLTKDVLRCAIALEPKLNQFENL